MGVIGSIPIVRTIFSCSRSIFRFFSFQNQENPLPLSFKTPSPTPALTPLLLPRLLTQKRPVSAALITFNEEKKIAHCLRSLTWVDEIVVVDAASTDQTRAIVLDPTQPWAKLISFRERAWSGFRDQRNYALSQTRHDWVLVIDADEVCTPELATTLQAILLQEKPDFLAYKVHRVEFLLGKRIHYGMWNPSYQDRFFYKPGVRYVNEVHEYPLFASPPGTLHASLLHHDHSSVTRLLAKMNQYTTLEAQDRYQQGQRTTVFKLVFAFPAHFLKSLFYYQAYRDGLAGVIIALLEGVSRVARQLKIWELMQQTKNPTTSTTPNATLPAPLP